MENVSKFGVPAIVAINHFATDTDAEVEALQSYVAEQGGQAVLCRHWADGSAGIENLAHAVVDIVEKGEAKSSHLW